MNQKRSRSPVTFKTEKSGISMTTEPYLDGGVGRRAAGASGHNEMFRHLFHSSPLLLKLLHHLVLAPTLPNPQAILVQTEAVRAGG